MVKLVRALRKGWLKPSAERVPKEEEEPTYLMWLDDGMASDKTAIGNGHTHIRHLHAGKLRRILCTPPMRQFASYYRHHAQHAVWDGVLMQRSMRAGLSYISAPKPQLPGHEESYHPPQEYLPSEVRPCRLSGHVSKAACHARSTLTANLPSSM